MKSGFVRIIAGKWRGRRLKVPHVKALRPTPDSVRETLFNWLAPFIEDAYCLDAFAGSGALGFEALSRGARHVVMIDAALTVVKLLREESQQLEIPKENISIYKAHAPRQLRKPDHLFNIVFLDPPYHAKLLIPCCHYLEEQHFLAKDAHIYLEAHHIIKDNELPLNWRVLKTKKAGQVTYHLARRE